LPAKVESRDIYLGAVPFVILQLLLVAVVIAFPETVTYALDKEKVVDIDKVEINVPGPDDNQNNAPASGDSNNTGSGPSLEDLIRDASKPATK
jgi:hypothetical protein